MRPDQKSIVVAFLRGSFTACAVHALMPEPEGCESGVVHSFDQVDQPILGSALCAHARSGVLMHALRLLGRVCVCVWWGEMGGLRCLRGFPQPMKAPGALRGPHPLLAAL